MTVPPDMPRALPPLGPWAMLALVTLATGCFVDEPVVAERVVDPGTPTSLTWEAGEGLQELWLDVRTTGGRTLTGPVEVQVGGKRIAGGTFSLAAKRMLDTIGSRVRNWVSTPRGARGRVLLLVLPELAPKTAVTKYVALVMHADEDGRKGHEAMGFHEGWG